MCGCGSIYCADNILIFAIFAIICAYPFYYLIINSISANDLSASGKVNFLPDSVEINDFDVESRIVGYESISNYYKLKHYYFFLIITDEVIPIFVDKKSLTNEEMEKLELLVQQKMPQLKNQTAKTIKQRFAFYNLHSQGDLYGM